MKLSRWMATGRFGDYVQRENWQNEKTILKNILEGKTLSIR
ncbi:hypothetical protein [Klebsiella pneumoniae]|nr:hypothetical protein [Klebsiella pneumoniae]